MQVPDECLAHARRGLAADLRVIYTAVFIIFVGIIAAHFLVHTCSLSHRFNHYQCSQRADYAVFSTPYIKEILASAGSFDTQMFMIREK